MPTNNRNESQVKLEGARSRSSSEMLTVLAPADDEPRPIRRMAIWKMGPETAPTSGSAA